MHADYPASPLEIRPADDAAAVAAAVAALGAGRLVVVPTETVYGLAADARDPVAVAKIFVAKGRPDANPLIVHVADLAAAEALAVFDDRARALAAAFWPGPLTLVLPRRDDAGVAAAVCAGLPTIAVRVPAQPALRALLAAAAMPLAAPSANRSGRVSPTRASDAAADLAGVTAATTELNPIAMVLDGGPCRWGLESTVVGLAAIDDGRAAPGPALLLRPGALAAEAIEQVVGPLARPGAHAAIQSPGMLLRHYAPRRPLRLQVAAPLPGEAWLVWEDAAALPRARSAQRGEPAVVPAPWRVLGAGTGDAAAAGLYAALRDADAADGYGGIAVAPLPSAAGGAWEAIGDRLARAALGASDQPVRVVVFDLGGVVVRIARSWAERCAAAGVTAPAGVDGDEALAACADAVDALMCGTITTDDLAARLSAALGGALAAPALAALYDHQILGPYPGVADVVARLRVPHAILSNTSAGHWPLLLQDPVVASATARFASFELGRIKPAGALFDHVAATLQEPPGHLLLLDDGDANVAGARAAGWQAERIDPLGDVAAQLEALFMRRGLLRPREEIR